jgi:Na+/pantothenate symporter
VKILKLGVVIAGVLGVVGMVMSGVDRMMEADKATTLVMLAAYALPVVLGIIALVRPPFLAWQAGVSLACFALATWKLRVWELFKDFGSAPGGFQLMAIGAVAGVILSVTAVMKPEQ